MRRSRAQRAPELKAELQEEMSALIEEYLTWHEGTERPTLTDIEEEVLKLRERMSARLVEVATEEQETNQPAETPRCPECGEVMRDKGKKATSVESRVGEVRMQRGYYYCSHCRRGFFPPG